MLNEDFVTYKQASKLKELGFYCIDFTHLYDEDEELVEYDYFQDKHYYDNYIPAPTLAQAQKWLREEKGVKVYVKPLFSSEEYEYWISFKFKMFMVGDECYGVEETWEYALSEGINEAIKLVEKEEQRNKRLYE